MPDQDLPPEIISQLRSVTRKRPKAVIDHLLAHGFVTTEELTSIYGYEHAPRAARDVREEGIPLETFRVKNSSGRTIGAYRFGDLASIRHNRLGGRMIFSKDFKGKLFAASKARCAVCATVYEPRYLQVDHRIPYEVQGDSALVDRKEEDYMLLCASCNRAKSWSCEHCKNWLVEKTPSICASCYWARPEIYEHIAMRPIRRLAVIWTEGETEVHDRLKEQSQLTSDPFPDFVKQVLREYLDEKVD